MKLRLSGKNFIIDVSRFGKEHHINYGIFRSIDNSSFDRHRAKIIIPKNSLLGSTNFSSFKRAVEYLKNKNPKTSSHFDEWCESFIKIEAPEILKF